MLSAVLKVSNKFSRFCRVRLLNCVVNPSYHVHMFLKIGKNTMDLFPVFGNTIVEFDKIFFYHFLQI